MGSGGYTVRASPVGLDSTWGGGGTPGDIPGRWEGGRRAPSHFRGPPGAGGALATARPPWDAGAGARAGAGHVWQSPARVLAWGGERQVAGGKGRVGRDLAVTEEAKFEAPPRLRDWFFSSLLSPSPPFPFSLSPPPEAPRFFRFHMCSLPLGTEGACTVATCLAFVRVEVHLCFLPPRLQVAGVIGYTSHVLPAARYSPLLPAA